MCIVIPVFQSRVSPRFDVSREFLLVTIKNGSIVRRRNLKLSVWNRKRWIRKFDEWGVNTLICGGIDTFSKMMLEERGVAVFAWVTGEAEAALAGYMAGDLESGVILGKGGRFRDRWRFGQDCGNE